MIRNTLVALLVAGSVAFHAAAQTKEQKLYQAVSQNDTLVARQLLRDKASPDYVMAVGPWMKVNPLITAVNKGNTAMVKLLLAYKANVNWRDGFQTSALMYAASQGSKELVLLLLANGADVKASDRQGNTVLSAAKESKNKEVIDLVEAKLK
ncbi:MAG: ankyrin repeat domain-containing protein [Janthinobacterium lividum]